MAEPELSIKVKVDPQINKAKFEEDVRAQVSNIKKNYLLSLLRLMYLTYRTKLKKD